MTDFKAQEWVDNNLKDKSIKKILLSPLEPSKVWKEGVIAVGGTLIDDLKIENYPNLEEVGLKNHRLNSLTIINCPNIKHVNIRNNVITKLEVQGNTQLKELIASQNKLTSLDLTNCQQIEELLVAKNSDLKELKKLNQNALKNLNIIETRVDLNKEEKELSQKNEYLLSVIKGVNEMGKEHELVLTEPIITPKQNDEAIHRLLTKTRNKWLAYFRDFEAGMPAEELAQKYPLLHLSFKYPKIRTKAKEILLYMSGVIKDNHTYDILLKEWNGDGEDYNPLHDYDLSLFAFRQHVKAQKPLMVNWEQQPQVNPIIFINDN